MSVNLQKVARRVVEESLGLVQSENYLFFTDFPSPWEERFPEMVKRRAFLHSLYEAFRSLEEDFPHVRHDKYESTSRHGGEPGENIWRLAFGESIYSRLLAEDLVWKLKGEVELSDTEKTLIEGLLDDYREEIVRCVLAFPWYSVTHTRFTRLLVRTGARFASMPLLTERVVEGPMGANWTEVAETTRRVYDALVDCGVLRVTTAAGTDLSLEIGESHLIHEDTGLLREPGSLGNLPAGEAYLVPKAESANGVVVFTSGPEKPVVEPTTAVVENGKVSFFRGETDYSRYLETKFERDFRMRHVAELGIGTNPRARDVSSMIEGEKIQGTVHVALGDDRAMGGQNEATEHWDHILVEATLTGERRGGGSLTFIADGRLLL